jgi:release factor glutamine methyltransferase
VTRLNAWQQWGWTIEPGLGRLDPGSLTQVAQFLLETKRRLAAVSETPGLDAQVFLAYLLGVSRAWILAHPEATLTNAQLNKGRMELARMEAGLPLPYVLGRWEFYGREFLVTPDVLIPRPETELLVERAIQWLKERPKQRMAADVGTGSGCIAITLAAQFLDLKVLAVDVSLAALRVAWENARRHQVERQVLIAQSDLLAATDQPLDIICANLPYIPTSTLRQLTVHAREPELALNGGPDGLQQIEPLLFSASKRLAEGGALLLEIEAGQGPAVLSLSHQAFPQARIELHTDLAGRDRLVEILLAGQTTP